MTPKRSRPLSAATASGVSPDDVVTDDELTSAGPATVDDGDAAERLDRFRAGVASLKVGAGGPWASERLLLLLAGIVAPLGLVVVVLGWRGASETPYQFEQVPYVISGGLLGLGLVFVGSFFYFAHWMTQLVKEHRVQSQAILAALDRIAEMQEEQAAASAARNGRRTRQPS